MAATKYTARASTGRDYRVKSIFICAFLMVFAIVSFVLIIYNIINLKFGFSLGYLLGFILILILVLFKMNVTFSSKIAADRKNLFLTTWENRLLPYKVSCTVPFIREFISDKISTEKIKISEIKDIYIGTKSYISRLTSDDSFTDTLNSLIPKDDIKKISKSDLLCIYDINSSYHIMNVENFDIRALCKVITNILRVNEKAEFHAGSKKYKLYVRK